MASSKPLSADDSDRELRDAKDDRVELDETPAAHPAYPLREPPATHPVPTQAAPTDPAPSSSASSPAPSAPPSIRLNLPDLLDDKYPSPYSRDDFHAYLKKELACEHLEFCEAVRAYHAQYERLVFEHAGAIGVIQATPISSQRDIVASSATVSTARETLSPTAMTMTSPATAASSSTPPAASTVTTTTTTTTAAAAAAAPSVEAHTTPKRSSFWSHLGRKKSNPDPQDVLKAAAQHHEARSAAPSAAASLSLNTAAIPAATATATATTTPAAGAAILGSSLASVHSEPGYGGTAASRTESLSASSSSTSYYRRVNSAYATAQTGPISLVPPVPASTVAEMKDICDRILSVFILPDSPREINISSQMRQTLCHEIQVLEHYHPQVFEAVSAFVLNMLRVEHFIGFQKSVARQIAAECEQVNTSTVPRASVARVGFVRRSRASSSVHIDDALTLMGSHARTKIARGSSRNTPSSFVDKLQSMLMRETSSTDLAGPLESAETMPGTASDHTLPLCIASGNSNDYIPSYSQRSVVRGSAQSMNVASGAAAAPAGCTKPAASSSPPSDPDSAANAATVMAAATVTATASTEAAAPATAIATNIHASPDASATEVANAESTTNDVTDASTAPAASEMPACDAPAPEAPEHKASMVAVAAPIPEGVTANPDPASTLCADVTLGDATSAAPVPSSEPGSVRELAHAPQPVQTIPPASSSEPQLALPPPPQPTSEPTSEPTSGLSSEQSSERSPAPTPVPTPVPALKQEPATLSERRPTVAAIQPGTRKPSIVPPCGPAGATVVAAESKSLDSLAALDPRLLGAGGPAAAWRSTATSAASLSAMSMAVPAIALDTIKQKLKIFKIPEHPVLEGRPAGTPAPHDATNRDQRSAMTTPGATTPSL
ncbi:hypothetical protein CXG81DRAFT_27674 [Caulochytrium protostelioides]|uniref:RGS domain-containing protein n=1 Tax=Caulochytrium protostelioides TaxID=1555241 RepID=A0A4P9X3H1_9FUNG|nr:hypothetical protein CXG81DRAFT_27674 [Caulochytrium protostelioides]|eukprot:RKO99579.1 hypothetical protein CXG81DRAFT_27674 [Caulochytrium protostelioides]